MGVLKSFLHSLRQTAVGDYQRRILDSLEPSRDRDIDLLDAGCDDGVWTAELGKRVGRVRLHGIEIVEERRQAAIGRGVDARSGDLNRRFPFNDASMDVVHANQVIEHLSDTDAFLQEIRRVLRPGGYAVICTENLASWHNIGALCFGWQPFSLANVCETKFQIGNPLAIHSGEAVVNPKSWQHLRVFAWRGLRDVVREYGFAVERYLGSGYYPLPNFVSKLDPRHAAFLTLKARKPAATESR